MFRIETLIMSSVSSLIFYGKYFLYYRCAIVNIMIIYFIVVFQKKMKEYDVIIL